MRNKTELKLIEDNNKRKVTTSKRKRGVIKKTIELSVMCGLDIFMVIFDREKQSLVEFSSEADFDQGVITHMLDKYNKQQFKNSPIITNDCYKRFIGYE
tara:strand:+ start:256 stop:552 length:297 start_codon:yes stop_codon:yes gene_type:complete